MQSGFMLILLVSLKESTRLKVINKRQLIFA